MVEIARGIVELVSPVTSTVLAVFLEFEHDVLRPVGHVDVPVVIDVDGGARLQDRFLRFEDDGRGLVLYGAQQQTAK